MKKIFLATAISLMMGVACAQSIGGSTSSTTTSSSGMTTACQDTTLAQAESSISFGMPVAQVDSVLGCGAVTSGDATDALGRAVTNKTYQSTNSSVFAKFYKGMLLEWTLYSTPSTTAATQLDQANAAVYDPSAQTLTIPRLAMGTVFAKNLVVSIPLGQAWSIISLTDNNGNAVDVSKVNKTGNSASLATSSTIVVYGGLSQGSIFRLSNGQAWQVVGSCSMPAPKKIAAVPAVEATATTPAIAGSPAGFDGVTDTPNINIYNISGEYVLSVDQVPSSCTVKRLI